MLARARLHRSVLLGIIDHHDAHADRAPVLHNTHLTPASQLSSGLEVTLRQRAGSIATCNVSHGRGEQAMEFGAQCGTANDHDYGIDLRETALKR
jgi:hypothetical protein